MGRKPATTTLPLPQAVEIDPADLMTQRLLIAGPTADIFAGELNGGAVAIKEYRRRSRLTLQQQLAFWREVRNFGSLMRCRHAGRQAGRQAGWDDFASVRSRCSIMWSDAQYVKIGAYMQNLRR